MGLETKVKMLIGVTVLTVVAGVNGFIYGRNHHISNNLEPEVITCTAIANLRGIMVKNLPLIRNKDLDENGKYESALFYKISDGRIVYQEITRNDVGSLVFSESKFYK